MHNERGRRFAYISTGDITTWAKGTTHASYPEPKNKRRTPAPVSSLDNCGIRTVAECRPQAEETVVLVGATPRKQADTMASDTDGMDVASFSSRAAAIFASLVKHK